MFISLDFRFNCLVTFELEIVMKKGEEEKKIANDAHTQINKLWLSPFRPPPN